MTLEFALTYFSRGFSIIPVKTGKKVSAVPWKEFQTNRADEVLLQRWFGKQGFESLAVVLGEVSGRLYCRDFDKLDSYANWSADYPELAKRLPSVRTARGQHVYFKSDDDLRRATGTDGTTKKLSDGELRGDGAYCLLPPSTHPDGVRYEWSVPIGDEVPSVDCEESGLLCNGEGAGGQKTLGEKKELSPLSQSTPSSLLHEVDQAIERTLPSGFGQRHGQVFAFARALKAIPVLAETPFSELRPHVIKWHQKALPFIRTQAFEETWFDFAEGWKKVRFPEGHGPFDEIVARACSRKPPEAAMQYEQPALRLLVALCRELQMTCGKEPFYLSARTAGRLLNVHFATACRWLKGLQVDEVLELVEKGSQKNRRASRYRYLGD